MSPRSQAWTPRNLARTLIPQIQSSRFADPNHSPTDSAEDPFFLCSLLDGFSRSIVHWEIRPKMEEGDIETIIQRARRAIIPGVSSPDHQRQWSPVHCQRLQRIHPHLRDDSCENFTVLSPKQWQDRAMASFDQVGVCPPWDTTHCGGCGSPHRRLCAALQRGAATQCDWLCNSCRQVVRS